MSNLRSNLSDTLAAARARASQYRVLLSPSSGLSGGSGDPGRGVGGVSFTSLGRRMAGLSTLSPSNGEGGSGEFSLRVGGGPGSKNYSIVVLSLELIESMCLGAVNNGIKFCMASASACTVGTHAKKVAVVHDHVYVNAGKGAAFSDPHVPATFLGSDLSSYLGELRPREDWLRLFQAVLDENGEDNAVKPLITPKKRKHRYFLEDSPSGLSTMESWDPMDSPEPVTILSDRLRQVDQRLTNFQLRVGDDVDMLFTRIQDVKASVGSIPVSLITEDCTTVWEMLAIIRSLITDPEAVQSLQSKFSDVDSRLNQHSQKLMTLSDTTNEMSELIQLLSVEQEQNPLDFGKAFPLSKEVAMDFLVLSERLERLEQSSTAENHSLLLSLQAEVKLLEARMPSNPFTIGGKTFNSKADVALFVEKDMPGVSYSVFHDIITLLESISDGHSKKENVMAAMYQAGRVGLDEDEATHVHSFKLIVPTLLGAMRDGDKSDHRVPLPGVRDFATWNPQDNEGGIKKRIQDGIDDVSLAIQESISTACHSLPAAAKLATEMLLQTQVFANELCSWVDSFYMELINTSQVPANEAWLLVASCLRKFFEVLRKHRAPADRAASKMDQSTRTTAYLWAMVQVHQELKLIRYHNFRGHPAVAPVITLHVFKTRVTNTAFRSASDAIKSLEKKLADASKNFDKLHERLQKLEKKN